MTVASKHFTYQTLILLASAFFSFFALAEARRLHPDEAFYMTIARNAAVRGDWLMTSEPVDKPPLTFYVNALALIILAVDSDADGVLHLDVHKGEFAGRITSVMMSILLVAVVVRMTRQLGGSPTTANLTGILLTLAPLRVAFAATAFTDMPMLLFGTVALWMASRRRWGWAGLWLSLSMWAKPQIIFYLPLMLGILVYLPDERPSIRTITTCLLRFVAPLLLAGILLFIWDGVRMTLGAESFYALGQARYTATALTNINDYFARISAWWDTNQYLFGHGIVTGALITLVAIIATGRQRGRPIQRSIMLLWVWCAGFFALHIVLTLNLFDRNQLVLLPMMVMLVSLSFQVVRPLRWILPVVVVVMMFFALQSAQGRLPIGGDDGRHTGIDELADYLNAKPIATVIYDTWLDWELDYYMGPWNNKRRVYYPSPDLLVSDAIALPETGVRYFVAPAEIDVTDWLEALDRNGFMVQLDRAFDNFAVYALSPPDVSASDS